MTLQIRKDEGQGPPARLLAEPLMQLLRYLNEVLAQCRESQPETQYVWDWEMLHEALHAGLAQSVYGGVLWHGLECLRSSGEGAEETFVMLAEGTREELVDHLSELATRYKDRLRRLNKRLPRMTAEGDALSEIPQEYALREDWRGVFKDVLPLLQIERAVDWLLLLLRRYARPVPFAADQMSAAKTRYYSDRLSKYRPYDQDQKRNRCDALNLASCDELESRRGSIGAGEAAQSVCLVSATNAVAASAPNITKDPIYFALDADLRRRFPNKTHRCQALLSMIGRTSTLLSRWGVIQLGAEKGPVGRSAAEPFMRALNALYDDPILQEVGRLVANSVQAVRNAACLARELSLELRLPDYSRVGSWRRVRAKLLAVLQELGYDQPPASFSPNWEPAGSDDGVTRYRLVGPGKQVLMDAEQVEATTTVSWQTEDSLDEFVRALASQKAGLCEERSVMVAVRVPGRPGLSRANVDCVLDIGTKLKALADGRKVSLVRLQIGPYAFWFESMSENWGPETRAPRASLIAARVGPTVDPTPVANTYELTSDEIIAGPTIRAAIESLRAGPG